jgi:hypothetical protein
LITSNGRADIALYINNNSYDNFIIRNSAAVPLFLVYESPLECVSRGKLSAWGDIVGLADLDITENISKGGGSF